VLSEHFLIHSSIFDNFTCKSIEINSKDL